MPVQELLGKITTYNAAIELPHAGLVGISAFLAPSDEARANLAAREIGACIDLCARGIRAIDEDTVLRRQDVYTYLAFRELLPNQEERQTFRGLLEHIRSVLSAALENLRDKNKTPPKDAELLAVETELRGIADKVKKTIPRDAYMASLVGTSFPGIAIRR
jgi:hypothetical protein